MFSMENELCTSSPFQLITKGVIQNTLLSVLTLNTDIRAQPRVIKHILTSSIKLPIYVFMNFAHFEE